MGNKKDYVLAMYDVRAKQNYIYKTKKLKEIQGASAIIRDVFKDFLYDEAKKSRVKGNDDSDAIYRFKKLPDGKPESFSFKKFEERMDGNQYIGEVVYDGGGNFIILFRDEDTCRDVTFNFTNRLLKERPGLNVMCTYVPVKNGDKYNSADKTGDYQRLYANHRINENQESTIQAWGSMPFVQADYISSMPITNFITKDITKGVSFGKKVTAESYAKYKKFFETCEEEKINEEILDKLVEEKGKESLLAVIYIDGNNMGAKVQKLLNGNEPKEIKKSYDDCVNELRKFSGMIQEICVDKRKEQIDEKLRELLKLNNKDEAKSRRLVVGAGDEITIICNARYAFKIAKMYLDNISKDRVDIGDKKRITSCAGIAIFRSHTPFADAYRIAEECCESGKKRMKDLSVTDACFLDWHYCQGAIGLSLEDIREQEEMTECSRPWLMVKTDDVTEREKTNEEFDYNGEIEPIIKEINCLERSNVKGLAESAKEGMLAFEMDLNRVISHKWDADKAKEEVPKLWETFISGKDDEKRERYRKLIFDLVLVYDIWFDESGQKEGPEEEKATAENGGDGE